MRLPAPVRVGAYDVALRIDPARIRTDGCGSSGWIPKAAGTSITVNLPLLSRKLWKLLVLSLQDPTMSPCGLIPFGIVLPANARGTSIFVKVMFRNPT
jgi:hypothetical protein